MRIALIAASAASVLALAGDHVGMSPTALLMIHDLSTIAMGNATYTSSFMPAITGTATQDKGKQVQFRSSATVPRLYRAKFKREFFKDLPKLEKSYTKRTEDGDELQIEDLEIFKNVVYIMDYHADPSIPKMIEERLDQFETFSIYQVFLEILELWGENLMTNVQEKTNWQK